MYINSIGDVDRVLLFQIWLSVAAPSKLLVRASCPYRASSWAEVQQRESAGLNQHAVRLPKSLPLRTHPRSSSSIGLLTGDRDRSQHQYRSVATRGMATAGPVAPVIVPELQPFFAWVHGSIILPADNVEICTIKLTIYICLPGFMR